MTDCSKNQQTEKHIFAPDQKRARNFDPRRAKHFDRWSERMQF